MAEGGVKLGVVFTQLSDGLLAANPVPPEKVHITRVNAMGKHDKLADITLSGDDLAPSNTVHDLKELLYSRLFMSRRFKLALYFWGKELEDETKALFDYKVITDSQLTLASVERSHAELAAIREQTPLRSLRIASNKVVPFTIDGIEPSLTAGELRRAIHSHLHTPITYLAIQNWNKEADTLIYKRGDQLAKEAGGGGGKKKDKNGGMRMRNLRDGSVGNVTAPADFLVELRVELADLRLFYAGMLMDDDMSMDEHQVVHDDMVFLDVKRPPPFDPEPPPVVPKGEKKKGGGKGKGKKK